MTPIRVGLTGGIGSGKSTVAAMMRDRGAAVIDADALARSVTAAAGPAMPEVLAAFGPGVAAADGSLDRAATRRLVFADARAKSRLEAIVHPWVGRLMRQADADAMAARARLIVHDIPLLVESGRWRELLDAVCVIDCSEATQVARVSARSQLPAAEVQRIMAQQATRAQRLAAADATLYNDGLSLDRLREEVDTIVSWWLGQPAPATA